MCSSVTTGARSPESALAAGPFHVVGGAEAVEGLVTRYRADEDLRHVDAAIGEPQRWRAALGYYRAAIRNSRPPTQYAQLHRHWLSAPRLPTLYLHGTDDGCSEDHTPWIERVLPDESELALVENAGHFLQLDQPDVVARHIVDFVGQAS
jgi:pimeloyl-ACP methyl ester carboxylesterase